MLKMYVFESFDGTTGEQELFGSESQAIKHAEEAWKHLIDRERKKMEYFLVTQSYVEYNEDLDCILPAENGCIRIVKDWLS